MLREIKLYGILKEKFGPYHSYHINSPSEAVRALSANHKDFSSFLINSAQNNIYYKVIADGEALTQEQLENPVSRSIEIIPVIQGAGGGGGGSGFNNILIGAALVGVSFVLPGSGAIIASQIGYSFIIAGAYQTLFPQPEAPTPGENADNRPSYNFNGPVQTSAQGQPVAVCYGRLTVGAAVISAGLTVIDTSVGPSLNDLFYTFLTGSKQ